MNVKGSGWGSKVKGWGTRHEGGDGMASRVLPRRRKLFFHVHEFTDSHRSHRSHSSDASAEHAYDGVSMSMTQWPAEGCGAYVSEGEASLSRNNLVGTSDTAPGRGSPETELHRNPGRQRDPVRHLPSGANIHQEHCGLGRMSGWDESSRGWRWWRRKPRKGLAGARAYERVTVRCAGMAFECQGTGRGESSIL